MLNENLEYSRKDNVVSEIETGKPVLKLKQWFPDIAKLSTEATKYLNKYCRMFPHLCERIESNQNEQLSLFLNENNV